MNNIYEIFDSRIRKENEKRAQYNKYIFNSHLIMFLIIVCGGILFNYSTWLKTTPIIQIKLVLFLILFVSSYIFTFFKVKTYIKEADSVFLLPLEKEYALIRKKLITPIIIKQIIIFALMLLVTSPILNKLGYLQIDYLIISITFLVYIILGTLLKYDVIVFHNFDKKYYLITFLAYILSNITIVFFKITFLALIFVLCYIIYYIVNKKSIGKNLNWYQAYEYDNNRLEKYYKFISMFIDVPINTIKVSRRKYFDIFMPKLKSSNFTKDNAYSYYYIRAFLRQENTIFLLIRLLFVAILIVNSLNNKYVSFVVLIAYNYLTIIQLIPLYRKMSTNLWAYIYPIEDSVKVSCYKKLMLRVMISSSLILYFYIIYLDNFSVNSIILASISFVIALFLNVIFVRKV